MSPRLPRLTSRQLIKVLSAHGWQHARTTGSHYIMINPRRRMVVSVPHHNRVMSVGTLSRILKDAGLTTEDLR